MSRLHKYLKPIWMKFRNMSTNTTIAKKNVEVTKVGNIFMIAINRPEKKNCVDPTTAKQLVEAFNEFEADSESPVAVFYGKGGTFCAGFDLGYLSSADGDNLSSLLLETKNGPMGPSRMRFKKPVIAAVSGHAVAGGLELALMCDLRVVEETAVMGVYCRRFGVPLIDGGTVRLPKLIGLSRAMDLILTGRGVSAKEAYEMGLANRITPTGTSVGAAVDLAQSIAKFPQGCMNADRLSAYHSVFDSPSQEEAIDFEFKNGVKVIIEEAIPGARKFVSGIGRHGSFNLTKSQL